MNITILRMTKDTLNKQKKNSNKSITTSIPPLTFSLSHRTEFQTKILKKVWESQVFNYLENSNEAGSNNYPIGYHIQVRTYLASLSINITVLSAINIQRQNEKNQKIKWYKHNEYHFHIWSADYNVANNRRMPVWIVFYSTKTPVARRYNRM